jgi:hypothetical protein
LPSPPAALPPPISALPFFQPQQQQQQHPADAGAAFKDDRASLATASSRIGAARSLQSLITIETTSSPKISPPYPINQVRLTTGIGSRLAACQTHTPGLRAKHTPQGCLNLPAPAMRVP